MIRGREDTMVTHEIQGMSEGAALVYGIAIALFLLMVLAAMVVLTAISLHHRVTQRRRHG